MYASTSVLVAGLQMPACVNLFDPYVFDSHKFGTSGIVLGRIIKDPGELTC